MYSLTETIYIPTKVPTLTSMNKESKKGGEKGGV